ncbi:MAG: M23 family metallopeptidase [Ginsengibacter sp.]
MPLKEIYDTYTSRRRFTSFIALGLILTGCYISKDPLRNTAILLQRGKLTEDTSYVYALPYKKGTSHLLIQGYFSKFSHKNRAALDFRMKSGTEIFAARAGIVIRLEEQHSKGGRNKKYRKDANLVVIQHEDGTKAGYWHLRQNGVLVNMGDTVSQGQLIALSGKTGYTFIPHLHFIVWTNNNSGWQQIPTRFLTSKGAKYLRPLRRYRRP